MISGRFRLYEFLCGYRATCKLNDLDLHEEIVKRVKILNKNYYLIIKVDHKY